MKTDMQFEPNTSPRSGSDLVAVNPERITTLLELAQEHYGSRCARCVCKLGKKHRPVVHHRHYRTLGFEKPVDDIVLLCLKCHADLHTRAKARQLDKTDIPFVDPRWADSLQNRRTAAEIDANWPEGIYNPRAYDPADMRPYRITFRTQAGELKTVRESYPNLAMAEKNAEAQRSFYSHAAVESIEEV